MSNFKNKTLMITGGTGSFGNTVLRRFLETDIKEIDQELFKNKTAILPNGNGIAVYYLNSLPVPVENMELKRMQINLQIKEWEVN